MSILSSKGTKAFLIYLLLLWTAINIFQGYFTRVNPDEAYYHLYGLHLDWGYFDHPPMVGLLTKCSQWIGFGHLSIRLMTVGLSTIMLWILSKKIIYAYNGKQFFVPLLLASAMPMVTAYGFITTPDVPLLFFTTLFLWTYKAFLKENTYKHTFLLGVLMSCMMYSKYHAAIIILLLILSNLSLLKNKYFWVAGIIALTLFMPHLYWQYSNDFPSLKYHLIQRSKNFDLSYLLMYPINQLLVFSPFVLIPTLWEMKKQAYDNPFEKTLYYLIYGFLIFFGFMAFRGHVEPHWTVVISIPIIILWTNKFIVHYTTKKLMWILTPSIILILLIRIWLIVGKVPENIIAQPDHYLEIAKIAGGKPVIFTGSFQKPSLFTYYTGGEAAVISSLESRYTQYDIWNFERLWIGSKVWVHGKYGALSKDMSCPPYECEGFEMTPFLTAKELKVDYRQIEKNPNSTDSLEWTFGLKNIYEVPISISNQDGQYMQIFVAIIQNDTIKYVPCKLKNDTEICLPASITPLTINFNKKSLPTNYQKISIVCQTPLGTHQIGTWLSPQEFNNLYQ